MSQEQRLCPGVGGCRCGAFMSPLFRDLHPTCARCRGVKCMANVTCDICKDWSVAHWEAFLRKRSYSGLRKSRPSGADLPTAPPTLPSSASASSEAGRPAPPPRPPTPPSEGRGRSRESEGIPRVGSREVSSPPPPTVLWGGAPRVLASGGASDSAVSSLPGVGVAGSFRSQESVVFAAPSSVASSASAERDHRSCSREVGGSTEDRYRSRSSWSSPSRGRDSCGEHRCAHSRSGWSRALSRESCSRSTDRSLSRGGGRFRRDSSHYPSARMRSRLSRSRLSDRYRSCRVRSRSQQVRSRSGHHGARRDRLRSHRSCYQSRDWSLLSSDRSQSRDRSWRPGRSRRDRTEAVVTSRDCGSSGSRVEPAPAVASSSIPRPTPSLPDLARLFLSLSGSLAQQDAVVGSLFSAVGVTSCLVLLLR